MPYITSIERLGLEKGIEQGMEQGLQQGMQQGIQQGRQQGMRQGMQQGMQQGEATVLNRQLQRKFGDRFTAVHRQRVKEADSEILLDWSEQVLYAQSIDEVFYSSKFPRSGH